MRFSLVLLGVVAASVLALCNVASAQDAPKATFDESLLEVKDGESVDYYKTRLADIQQGMNSLYNAYRATDSSDERAEILSKIRAITPKANAANKAVYGNLIKVEGLEAAELQNYYVGYARAMASASDLDGVKKLEEQVADRPELVAVIVPVRFSCAIDVAYGNKDALKAVAKEILDYALANPGFGANAANLTTTIGYSDEEVGGQAIVDLAAAFSASGNDDLVAVAKRVEGKVRFAQLVGKEMVVEGLFLNGEEIKWADYRGKVVLVDFWATWCGPCVGEIPNVEKLYGKYHEAGFEVVGYSLDNDLDALKKFEEERKLPWETMSRKISMAAEKEYVNLTDYYGVNAIPTMVLVGRDGKVIDTNARGEHLRELLEKEFPNVK